MSGQPGLGRTPYRADIDGLRALSVIGVILFHAGLPAAAGGFVGVDVFFVISGYLITQWLLARVGASPRELLREFYLRRARRILPALVLMLSVTTPIAWLLLLPPDLVRHGMYLLAAVLIGGNFAAWSEGDYFNMTVGFAPLLHLWSIAVEEQFYLLFPLLMLALRRFTPTRQVRGLMAVALPSFIVCVAASYTHPVANFYFGLTRAWELLLGALLAYGVCDGLARRGATPLATVGLAAILAAMLLFRRELHHPGLSTLLPTLGTAAFIVAGRAGQTVAARILGLRPLAITGQASYSLYLWHLPALVFITYAFVQPPRGLELAAVLAGTAVVAFAAWAGFERPLRRGRWLPRTRDFVTASLVSLWLLAVIGMTWLHSDGFPQRFPPDEVRILDSAVLHRDAGRCMTLPVQDIAAGRLCRYGPANAPRRAVLWGDSHALSLLPGYESLAERDGFQLFFAGRSICRPLAGLRSHAHWPPKGGGCPAFNDAMRMAVEKIHPDVVILSAFWAFPDLEFAGVSDGRIATFADALHATTRELGAVTKRVCIVRDVPMLRHPVPHGLIMLRRHGASTDILKRFDPAWRDKQRAADEALVAFGRDSAVTLVDPKAALCTQDSCRIELDGKVLFRDSNHLSVTGANYVAESLAGCFENLR